MTKWTKSLLPAALFLIQSFVCIARAHADPITYLQTGGSDIFPMPLQGGPIVADPQFLGVSFTLDHPLQNISISVPQLEIEQDGLIGTAWLTNALGPGTTAANVLATNQFAVPLQPNPHFASYTFFNGLNLDAGTYNFFISSPDCDATHPCHGSTPHGYGVASWVLFFPGEVQSVEGVHYNNELHVLRLTPQCDGDQFDPANGCNINYAFVPASNWDSPNGILSFAITQTVAEPSSLALCSVCIPLIIFFRRRL